MTKYTKDNANKYIKIEIRKNKAMHILYLTAAAPLLNCPIHLLAPQHFSGAQNI